MAEKEKKEIEFPRTKYQQNKERHEKEKKEIKALKISGIIVGALLVIVLIAGVLYEYVYKPNMTLVSVNGEKTNVKQFQEAARYQRASIINEYQQMAYLYQAFGMAMPQTTIDQYKNQLDPSYSIILGQQVVTSIENEKALDYGAKKLGISVDQSEVNSYMQNEFGYHPNGTSTPAPTEVPFESTPTISQAELDILKYTPTAAPTATAESPINESSGPADENSSVTTTIEATAVETETVVPQESATPTTEPTITMTPTEYTEGAYKTQVSSYFTSNKYFSQSYFEKEIYYQLLRTKVLAEVTKDLPKKADMVWARHLLVPTQEAAQKLIDRLNAGEDWGKLADELNNDKGSDGKDDTTTKAEDLGWFQKSDMVDVFATEAFGMDVGSISKAPIQTVYGWHVIQVIGHEERPLTSSQYDTAKNNAYSTWIENTKKEMTIKENTKWMEFVPTEPAFPTTY